MNAATQERVDETRRTRLGATDALASRLIAVGVPLRPVLALTSILNGWAREHDLSAEVLADLQTRLESK